MTNATAETFRNGDGYLQVDTVAWFADRGEVDDSLTDMLRQWIADEGIRYASAEDITRFFAEYEYRVTHGGAMLPAGYLSDGMSEPLTFGLYGDGPHWDLGWTGNQENFFSRDFGIVVLSTESLGSLAIDYINSGSFLGDDPTVYRTFGMEETDWADWAQAWGQCVNGHHWSTDDNYRLYFDGGSSGEKAPTISDQSRYAFGGDRQYIACPTCNKALHFIV
jgi:hypothetical protein